MTRRLRYRGGLRRLPCLMHVPPGGTPLVQELCEGVGPLGRPFPAAATHLSRVGQELTLAAYRSHLQDRKAERQAA